MGNSMKHGNNKNEPDTTSIGSGPVPNVETEPGPCCSKHH